MLKKIFFIANCLLLANIVNATTYSSSWRHNPPYQQQVDGKLEGVDIEIANLISARSDIKFDFKNKPWNLAIADTLSGRQDLIFGATKTAERSLKANFSVPYRQEKNVLISRLEGNKQLIFTTPEELINELKKYEYRLGTIKGVIYASPIIEKYIRENRIKGYDDTNYAHNALKRGEIDGFLLDAEEASDRYKGQETTYRMQDLGAVAEIFIMVNKMKMSQSDLVKLNNIINSLKNCAEYKAIMAKYSS